MWHRQSSGVDALCDILTHLDRCLDTLLLAVLIYARPGSACIHSVSTSRRQKCPRRHDSLLCTFSYPTARELVSLLQYKAEYISPRGRRSVAVVSCNASLLPSLLLPLLHKDFPARCGEEASISNHGVVNLGTLCGSHFTNTSILCATYSSLVPWPSRHES
jgi:hypothetical protein